MNRSHKLMKLLVVVGFLTVILGFSDKAVAQTWIELAPTGAPPQPVFSRKNIHYDAANNRLIAFYPGNPPFNGNPPGNGNEVWILTNANGLGGTPAWTKLLPSGSPPFSNGNETAVYDRVTNRLIVYGGCFANCSPALSNVFALSNANGLGGSPVWSQSTVTNPQARAGLSAVDDSANNLMITFAGHLAFFGTDHNDIRILSNANGTASPSTWTTLGTSGGPPGIRDSHSAIYDQATNRMTIFAGHNSISSCCPFVVTDYNDAWVLSNANGQSGTPTWTQLAPLGSLPGVRSGHSAVYDPANNQMIVFGGLWNQAAQTSTFLGDLWQLTHANGLGGTPEWSQLSQSGAVPGPRFWHTAAFDSVNQRMIILGGVEPNDVTSNRVWVLILNQAPTCVPPPSGLVGWWPGDGNANDISGTGLNGTVRDGVSFSAGKVSLAFDFDGVDDRVEIADSPALRFGTGDLTVDAWIKVPLGARYRSIIGKEQQSFPFPSIVLRISDQGLLEFAVTDCGTGDCGFSLLGGGGSRQPVQSPFRVDDDVFHHVAGVRHSSGYELYVDGQLVATRTEPARNSDNGVPLFIGIQAIATDSSLMFPFKGIIDEVEIFNRTLTASEIQAIFNAGSAGKCKAPANRPPVAKCRDVTVSAESACTANASIDDGSFDPDGDSITITQSPLGPYPLGTTNVTLTITDSHGASNECTATVTVVDDTPPVIACPNNITANTDVGQCSTVVSYAAPEASDNCSGAGAPTCNPPSGATFPKGTTTVNCSVTDAAGNQAICSFTVTIADTQAPTITMIAGQQMELWPPNHQYQTVSVSDFVASASDNCSGNLTNSVVIASISSDEPDDASGGGDGNTINDIVIAADCRTAQLRAERQGSGNGRVYTITFRVKDAAGNVKTATAQVKVPKSQGSGAAVDDGANHTINSACP